MQIPIIPPTFIRATTRLCFANRNSSNSKAALKQARYNRLHGVDVNRIIGDAISLCPFAGVTVDAAVAMNNACFHIIGTAVVANR